MKFRRDRTYKLFPKTKTKVLNITTSLIMVASSVSGAIPLLLSSSATAAPGIVYSSGTGFSDLPWTQDRTAPSGGYTVSGNSLALNVDNTKANTSAQFYRTEGLQATLPSGLSTLKASLYLNPAWATIPVRAGMWGVTTNGTDDAWPIIEYASNINGYTGLRVYDTNTGDWYPISSSISLGNTVSLEIALNHATHTYDFYVDGTLVKSYANEGYETLQAVIFDSYNSALTSADNYSVHWKDLQAGETPTVSSCATTNSVVTNDLSNWDLSQTRATGHNEVTANGLHIWTEGTTSTDKAAGYYATAFPLSALGDQSIAQSMNYDNTSGGGTPGLQLTVDFNDDGVADGYLVGESVYGNDWWLSSSASQFVKDGAPNNGGGYGSQWYGTPDEWLRSFPSAQVKAIGYSLGSGVLGNGVIKSINLGCTNYAFTLAAPSLIAPSNESFVNGESLTNRWSAVAGAAKYEYQSFNDAAAHNLRFDGTYTTTSKTATDVANGTVFYWRVRAVDSMGAAGPWSNNGDLWKVTVDDTVPTTPTLLSPVNRGYEKTNSFDFTWNASSDNSGQPVTYEFQSSLNPAQSGGVLTTGLWKSATLNSPTIHSSGAPDGAWYWQVRAKDIAGNYSAWSPIWKVTLDSQAPVTTIDLLHLNKGQASTLQSGNVLTITGAATDNLGLNRVYVQLIEKSNDHRVGQTINLIPDGTTGNWQAEFNTKQLALPDGDYYAVATVTDMAGNSTTTSFLDFTLDNSRPSLSFTAPASFSTPFKTGPTVSVHGSDANGLAVLVIHVYNASTNKLLATPSCTATETQLASGDLSCDLSALAEGNYFIKAGTNDSAGNNQTITSATFTIDRSAPKVTDNLAVNMFTGDTTTLAPTVTGESGTLTYQWAPSDKKLLTNQNEATDGPTLEIGNAPKGTYTVDLTVTDHAGNATTVTYNVTISDHANNLAAAFVVGRGAGNLNSPNNGNGQDNQGGTNDGNVLGTSTTTSKGSQGQVKGDSTVNLNNTSSSKKSSKFLFLGWWWLLILAVLGIAWFILAQYRRSNED